MPQKNPKKQETQPTVCVCTPSERETGEVFFDILEGINAGIYVADLVTFEVMYANRYMRDFFGDIVGKACWQTMQTGQTHACDFCHCATKLRDDPSPGKTCSWIQKNTKSERWFYIQDRSILWEDGRLVRLSVYTDITEQKEMAEALDKAKKGLSRAQQMARIGSWEWDLSSNKATWSDQLYRLLGFEPGSIGPSHETFENMVHPDDLPFLKKTFKRALKDRASYKIEFRLLRKNGTVREVISQGFPYLDPNGHPVSMVGITQDITDRKQSERDLLEAKRRAEAATKLKDKFLSLVAHDLRSPLTWMLGFLRRMLKDEVAPLDQRHEERIEKILAGGEHMIGMIDDLLQLSRLRTGEIMLSPRFMDRNLPISVVLGQIAPVAMEKGIEVVNEIPNGGRLYADEKLFRSVIQNLVTNAIKFCNRGDRITLFTPVGEPDTIAIKDTGTGMDRKFMKNLFRPDVQTSRLGTGGESGNGMGLPLCKDIITAHKGKIRVESRVGEGSVFYIQMPRVRPKIVLVEDDELTSAYLKRALEGLEADILEAKHGREALNILNKVIPDLVITDIEMPVMDGFTLMENIRQHPKIGAVPVIVLTVKPDLTTRERAIRAGASDFIAKTATAEELLLRVMKYMG